LLRDCVADEPLAMQRLVVRFLELLIHSFETRSKAQLTDD
jgi:hypothetical protein